MATDSPIENFARVDDALWRGARPDAAGAAWLVAQGVRTIINLELLHGDQDEFGPALASLTYLWLPDWEPFAAVMPKIEDRHIKLFLAAIRLGTPRPIYAHCRDGQNRTGLAVAAYRLIEKNDPLDAVLEDMMSYHGLWEAPDVDYIRSLDARRGEFV